MELILIFLVARVVEDLAESRHIISRERTSWRNVEQSVEVSPRSEEQMVGVPMPPQYQAQIEKVFRSDPT